MNEREKLYINGVMHVNEWKLHSGVLSKKQKNKTYLSVSVLKSKLTLKIYD